MYTISIMLLIGTFSVYFVSGGFRKKCGINKNIEFYYQSVDCGSTTNFTFFFSVLAFVYFVWDITTLLLYVCKIRSFKRYKSENVIIYSRILSNNMIREKLDYILFNKFVTINYMELFNEFDVRTC